MILCVDDHEFSLKVRKLLLERQGYRVITATTVEEGEEKFSHYPVSLAVVDYYLPDGTGEHLAQAFKAMRPDVPVMMLSGSIDLPETLPGVDVLLPKVTPPSEFLEAVGRMMGREAVGVAG